MSFILGIAVGAVLTLFLWVPWAIRENDRRWEQRITQRHRNKQRGL